MAKMELTQNRRLEFESFWSGMSWCWLRVYHEPDTTNIVVIFTEPIDKATGRYLNPGTSITNAAERISNLVRQMMGGLEPVRWIHYYPIRGEFRKSPEEFSQVTFERSRPHYHKTRWEFMTRAAVEEIIGGPFEPLPENWE